MTSPSPDYDDVKQYQLNPEREQELLQCGGECTFIRANKACHPIGVTTAYVAMDTGKTVTYKGNTVIHDNTDTKLWFYNILAAGTTQAYAEFAAQDSAS